MTIADYLALARTEQEEHLRTLSADDLLRLGIELYNDGYYFEAHESWEEVWTTAPRALRPFYQGLIQVAAAFVHLGRGEYPGTHRLLKEGYRKLEAYRPDFLGVWLDDFVAGAVAAWERCLALGERRFKEFDRSLIPRLGTLSAGEARMYEAGGARLRYREWEGRGRPLILAHAPGHLARLWQPVAGRLAPEHRVLAPDLPGHGESERVDGSDGEGERLLIRWAREVAPGAAAVVGVGPGGGLAARLAAALRQAQDGAQGGHQDAALGTRAIVCAPGESIGPPGPAEARGRRLVWGNHWEMFDAYRERAPYEGWRADLLWWYVEHGSREMADGRLELRCAGETEAALLETAGPAQGVMAVEASPLVRPDVMAAELRTLLEGRG